MDIKSYSQDIALKAKELEKEQKGYSEEDVREMLFMALNEPQEECCTTHTKGQKRCKLLFLNGFQLVEVR